MWAISIGACLETRPWQLLPPPVRSRLLPESTRARTETERTARATPAKPKVAMELVTSRSETKIKRARPPRQLETFTSSLSGIMRSLVPFVGGRVDIVVPVSTSTGDAT